MKLSQSKTSATGPFFFSTITVSDVLLASVVVLVIGLWFWTRLGEEVSRPSMPDKVQSEEERQLYLEPGGLYSRSDMEANGGLTASERFVGFRAEHDFQPAAGDQLCPVTRTKANPDCAWVIGGQRYTFCCPPCIDEFLGMAKREPDQVRPPEAFIKE